LLTLRVSQKFPARQNHIVAVQLSSTPQQLKHHELIDQRLLPSVWLLIEWEEISSNAEKLEQ
jgi:hypothetical protein